MSFAGLKLSNESTMSAPDMPACCCALRRRADVIKVPERGVNRASRIARRDAGVARMAREPRDAVVVAVELNAVPMNRRRFGQMILTMLTGSPRLSRIVGPGSNEPLAGFAPTVVQHVAERRFSARPPESIDATRRNRRRAGGGCRA
jgi:hypothetical protein